MLGIDLKHYLATVAVAGGLLAAAGPAGAATAPAYQHNQTDHASLAVSPQAPGSGGFWLGSNDALGAHVADGTSNTIAFGERAAAPRAFSIDIGTSENIAADGLGAD